MANINLAGQKAIQEALLPQLYQAQAEIEKRLPAWQKLPDERKKQWIDSGKDPVMESAFLTYKYLHGVFKGLL